MRKRQQGGGGGGGDRGLPEAGGERNERVAAHARLRNRELVRTRMLAPLPEQPQRPGRSAEGTLAPICMIALWAARAHPPTSTTLPRHPQRHIRIAAGPVPTKCTPPCTRDEVLYFLSLASWRGGSVQGRCAGPSAGRGSS